MKVNLHAGKHDPLCTALCRRHFLPWPPLPPGPPPTTPRLLEPTRPVSVPTALPFPEYLRNGITQREARRDCLPSFCTICNSSVWCFVSTVCSFFFLFPSGVVKHKIHRFNPVYMYRSAARRTFALPWQLSLVNLRLKAGLIKRLFLNFNSIRGPLRKT